MAILFGLLMSFWRRWFGGGFKDTWLGNNRGIQAVFFITSSMLLFCDRSWQGLLIALAVVVYIYAQFWSRGHGACYDEGRDEFPSSTTISRYNERWYHYVCDLLPNPYGFLYDFVYMGMRYTCPMIPLGFINPVFWLIGLLVSPIYAFCWTLQEREHWIFEKYKSLQSGTNLAEYLVGFVYGVLFYMVAR